MAVNEEVVKEADLSELGVTEAELTKKKSIEVGNIFSLGTKFSEALNVSVEFLVGGEDVSGQIEDVLQHVPPRMTGRQLYLAQGSSQ